MGRVGTGCRKGVREKRSGREKDADEEEKKEEEEEEAMRRKRTQGG